MATSKRDEYRYKVITDPVHGDIGLSQLEVDLIDTQSFQRLRHLKQLGLASLVYPTANQTRFAHSLGVFCIVSRALDRMVGRRKFTNEDRRVLRTAALLHDIGHYPLSHLMEYIDRDPHREALLKGKGGRMGIQPYPSHEELGELIVTARTDIVSVLDQAKIDAANIAAIIRGAHQKRKFNQLLHSTLDLDRMDYLVRDAIATGVPFGRVDLHYLLNNLDIDSKGTLVLQRKAATAAEHFVLARYFMSKSVYLHKTIFGFEALMRRTLSLMRSRGKLWQDGAAIKKLVRDPTEFLLFHDGLIDAKIEEYSEKGGENSTLRRLCRALRDRKPPKLVREASSLTPRSGNRDEELVRLKSLREPVLKKMADACAIPFECWLWEDPKDVAFEKLGPLMTLTEAARITPDETTELIQLIDERGKTQPLIEDEKSIVHHLSNFRFQMARLYVVEDDEAKVEKARQEVKAWLEQ